MVCERHDQIQCPSTAVCRRVDVLDYVESGQQIAQSSSIVVVHIVDTDVDVTADHDRIQGVKWRNVDFNFVILQL